MEIHNKEVWMKVPDASFYEVSNIGRIRSIDRTLRVVNNISDKRSLKGKILRQSPNKNGYLYMRYVDDSGQKKRCLSHRLIAKVFIENPYNYGDINHINGNKKDNRVENLEWCTRSHNIAHAFKNGLNKITERQKTLSRKRIIILYPDGTKKIANSVKEASVIMGYKHYNSLCNALKNNSFGKNGITAKYL